MQKPRILWLMMASVFLFGCFQTETLVRIKPDGSGVIEETFLLPKPVLDSLQNLAKEFNPEEGKAKDEEKPGAKDPIESMIKDARAKAGEYGPTVKFLSATPVKTGTLSGYKALYTFEDINTLRINQNPENKAERPGDPTAKKEENILFRLVKGPTSTLFVSMPKYKTDKKDQKEQPTDPPKDKSDLQSMEMIKEVLKDMAVKVSLEIDGTILKTNATHRHKSVLTLLEIHFGKIFENKEVFEKVSAAEPKTIEEMKELVKGLEGLKIEMNDPVVVEFK